MLKDYNAALLWKTTEYLNVPALLETSISKLYEPKIAADAEGKIINAD